MLLAVFQWLGLAMSPTARTHQLLIKVLRQPPLNLPTPDAQGLRRLTCFVSSAMAYVLLLVLSLWDTRNSLVVTVGYLLPLLHPTFLLVSLQSIPVLQVLLLALALLQAQLHVLVGKAGVVVPLQTAATLLGVRTALPLGWVHPAVVVRLPSPIQTHSLLPAPALVTVCLRTGWRTQRELRTPTKLLLSHPPRQGSHSLKAFTGSIAVERTS